MAQDMIPAWVEGVLQPVEKLEAHRKGLRHLAISVFVTRGNKVLLQQRALSTYHTPGLWANTCCTHPYWGEDAPTCAARRLGQELGIVGLKLRHMGQLAVVTAKRSLVGVQYYMPLHVIHIDQALLANLDLVGGSLRKNVVINTCCQHRNGLVVNSSGIAITVAKSPVEALLIPTTQGWPDLLF